MENKEKMITTKIMKIGSSTINTSKHSELVSQLIDKDYITKLIPELKQYVCKGKISYNINRKSWFHGKTNNKLKKLFVEEDDNFDRICSIFQTDHNMIMYTNNKLELSLLTLELETIYGHKNEKNILKKIKDNIIEEESMEWSVEPYTGNDIKNMEHLTSQEIIENIKNIRNTLSLY